MSTARPQFQPLSAAQLSQYKRAPLIPQKAIRIADMGFDPGVLSQVPPKVLDLTDLDLQDLATKVAGGTTTNPRVNSLNIQDLQGIEYIFKDYREQKLATIASSIGDTQSLAAQAVIGAEWSISCCCCTPCCCCAAVDMNPFEA
jgi:hypothetical protein